MSKVAGDIKQVYDAWLSGEKRYRGIEICDSDPFRNNHWMINYLFPEVLLVAENYIESMYSEVYELNFLWELSREEHRENYEDKKEGLIVFPCWVMPEEDVLRIMAECGIL